MKNITPAVKPFPYQELLKSVKAPEVLLAASEVGEELGRNLYLVGGPVRDFFLGKPVKDLDLVVEGEAEPVARALAERLQGRIRSRSLFKTFKIVYAGGDVDLAMARKEVYPEPAALPQVSPAGILEDLTRRDFTANAMAVGLSGKYRKKLLDPLDGLRDLEAGWLRVLHENSFVDDPTRIFRAARYAARFNWRLSPETFRALARAYQKETPLRLTPARILGEIKRVLEESDPEKVLVCLEELGLWLALGLPEPPRDFGPQLAFLRKTLSEKILLKGLLIALAEGQEEKLLRIGLAPSEAGELSRAWQILTSLLEDLLRAQTPSQRYRLLLPYPLEVITGFFLKYRKLRDILKEYLENREVRTGLSGKDLQRIFGLPPGPLLGEILRQLLYARLDGRVKTREDELQFVRTLISEEA